ncbi:ParA family protein [Streptomyces carpaticus]|uniref:ParA family protein n=1 Tax=Streptomyces carpaticus TaxID=285558 RepID=UPI0021FC3F35|nr:ParA family protein [Streptomyces carpaticus]
MAKVIALFNNKGGVSKTTTCFNLGWMLAERGKRVVMVDGDPQCNLTGMVLDLSQADALDAYYSKHPLGNLKEALEPAFKSRPRPLEPVECVSVEGRDGLFLVPGHVALAEDEVSLGIAQQLSESVQALRNLPGSFRHLIDITAKRYEADFVLIDLSPGLGAINQNLVATADYFLIPTSPDVFSVMAIDSLARIVPQWKSWSQRASQLEALATADYPFPAPTLKFLGVVVQRYRLRNGAPTRGFEKYFQLLGDAIDQHLQPALDEAGALLSPELYREAGLDDGRWLASIPDFNTLIADSQRARKPVFALTQPDVERVGTVWENTLKNITRFRDTFNELAQRVESLTETTA